jgi:hypothetical protein
MRYTVAQLAIGFAVLSFALQIAVAQNAWKITDQSGEVTLISNGRLKQSWAEDGLIMDGKKNQILFLSSKKKAYAKGTPEEYCKLMKEAQETMMAKLPPDQRAAVEGMYGKKQGGKAPKVVVKAQGAGGKVSGLQTEKYAVYADNELYEEVWLATDPDFLKHFKPLASIFRVFSECVGSMALKDPVESSKEYMNLYEMGIEVKARKAGSEAKEEPGKEAIVERVAAAEAEFAVPPGYMNMDLRTFVYGQMGGMDGNEQ